MKNLKRFFNRFDSQEAHDTSIEEGSDNQENEPACHFDTLLSKKNILKKSRIIFKIL